MNNKKQEGLHEDVIKFFDLLLKIDKQIEVDKKNKKTKQQA